MVVLIVLNIILIVVVIFLSLYFIKNKKDDNKNICINYDDKDGESDDDIIEDTGYKQNKKIKSERVFVGRFVTDEEYQQMTKNRRSDISILLEEVNKEYEHLKELNK